MNQDQKAIKRKDLEFEPPPEFVGGRNLISAVGTEKSDEDVAPDRRKTLEIDWIRNWRCSGIVRKAAEARLLPWSCGRVKKSEERKNCSGGAGEGFL